MNLELQQLERQFRCDPTNIGFAQTLMNARIRTQWKHQGKTIEEWELELRSHSKFRIISALCQLSELGILAIDLWPSMIHALDSPADDVLMDNSWGAFGNSHISSVEHRLGFFFATLSVRRPERIQTFWRWLSEFKETTSAEGQWSHSKATAAVFALGHIAKDDPALIPPLLNDFIATTPDYTLFNMSYRREISHLLSGSNNDLQYPTIDVREALGLWIFEERTLNEWLIELRSGTWNSMRTALGAIQHLGVLAVDLWPDIIKSLSTPFRDEPFMGDFGDDFLHENFGEFLAFLAIGDQTKIDTLKQWLLAYDHHDPARKTLGIIAVRALANLAKQNRTLIPMLVESFNNTSVLNDRSDSEFYHVFFSELAPLLPEAQATRDKLFDFALKLTNPGRVLLALGPFNLEHAQFATILNRFILNDYYCNRREASIRALSIQLRRYPERLDWIIKAIETRADEFDAKPDAFNTLSGDLETLSQIHETKPIEVIHLLATCFNNIPLGDAKNRTLMLQSLKTDFHYFGNEFDYESLYTDERQANEVREAAFIGVAILTEDQQSIQERLGIVPEELRGHLFEKACLFFRRS